jgi:hypothetical protein
MTEMPHWMAVYFKDNYTRMIHGFSRLAALQQQMHSAACVGMPTGPLPNFVPAMADADETPAPPATPLKEAEDYVALFLNGGACTNHTHDAATDLHKLILLKQLRLEMPHQSTNIKDLDAAIRKALK